MGQVLNMLFSLLRRGSVTSGSISFSGLVGIGSNIQVVDLDDLTSLVNFLPDIIKLVSKEVHKVITAVLLGNVWG